METYFSRLYHAHAAECHYGTLIRVEPCRPLEGRRRRAAEARSLQKSWCPPLHSRVNPSCILSAGRLTTEAFSSESARHWHHPKLMCWNPTPRNGIRRWGFGGTLINGLRALMRVPWELALSNSFPPCEDPTRKCLSATQTGFSPEPSNIGTLISASRTLRDKFLLFKPPNFCYRSLSKLISLL